MSLKLFACCLAMTVLCTFGLFGQTRDQNLQPHTLAYAPGKSITLSLPAKLDINVAASGLRRVRFLAQAPDGRIFATGMYNLADNTPRQRLHPRRLGCEVPHLRACHSLPRPPAQPQQPRLLDRPRHAPVLALPAADRPPRPLQIQRRRQRALRPAADPRALP